MSRARRVNPLRCSERGNSPRKSHRRSAWSGFPSRRSNSLARPIDRLQRHRIETVRVKQGRLIVVAQNRDLTRIHDPVQALARIGTVADDVAQAVDLRHALLANVLQDHLQGFDVRVNITDEGPLHDLLPFRPSASTSRSADDSRKTATC